MDNQPIIPELDEETRREKERKHRIIVGRIARSKLSDSFRVQDDKESRATAELQDGSTAVTFPSFDVESTQDGTSNHLSRLIQGRVTLLTLSFQAVGHSQLETVHDSFLASFARPPVPPPPDSLRESPSVEQSPLVQGHLPADMGMVDLMYNDGIALSLLRWAMVGGIRRAVPEHRQPHTFLKFQPYVIRTEDFCDAVGVHNRVMAYSFLLDRRGRIRWRAFATLDEEELLAMVAATEKLRASEADDMNCDTGPADG